MDTCKVNCLVFNCICTFFRIGRKCPVRERGKLDLDQTFTFSTNFVRRLMFFLTASFSAFEKVVQNRPSFKGLSGQILPPFLFANINLQDEKITPVEKQN